MASLCDAHCHLFMKPLAADWVGVRKRAIAANVTRMIVAGFDTASWDSLYEYSQSEGVYIAAGLHPWVTDALDVTALSRTLDKCRAVAIGEIGLDYHINQSSRSEQIEKLTAQLDLACRRDLPVALHCRGAFEDLLEILASYTPHLRGMVHGFSRGPELAKRFTDLGLYISFGGALTRQGAKRARRSAEVTPLSKILIETDAPAIGLEGVDPEEVEPRHTHEVAVALADLRGVEFKEIAEATTENAKRLFGIE